MREVSPSPCRPKSDPRALRFRARPGFDADRKYISPPRRRVESPHRGWQRWDPAPATRAGSSCKSAGRRGRQPCNNGSRCSDPIFGLPRHRRFDRSPPPGTPSRIRAARNACKGWAPVRCQVPTPRARRGAPTCPSSESDATGPIYPNPGAECCSPRHRRQRKLGNECSGRGLWPFPTEECSLAARSVTALPRQARSAPAQRPPRTSRETPRPRAESPA